MRNVNNEHMIPTIIPSAFNFEQTIEYNYVLREPLECQKLHKFCLF